jgi:hypothetical protein
MKTKTLGPDRLPCQVQLFTKIPMGVSTVNIKTVIYPWLATDRHSHGCSKGSHDKHKKVYYHK